MFKKLNLKKYFSPFGCILFALGIFTVPFFIASLILFSPNQGTKERVAGSGTTQVPVVPKVEPINEDEKLNLEKLAAAKDEAKAKKDELAKANQTKPTPAPTVRGELPERSSAKLTEEQPIAQEPLPTSTPEAETAELPQQERSFQEIPPTQQQDNGVQSEGENCVQADQEIIYYQEGDTFQEGVLQ